MTDAMDRYLTRLMADVADAAPPAPPFPAGPRPLGDRPRRPRTVAAIALGSFIAVLALAGALYLVTRPGTSPAPPASPDVSEPIEFATADGLTLRGELWRGNSTGILLAGAYGAEPRELHPILEPLAARGYTVMTYALRGQGGSDGPVDVPASVADLGAALDFLRSTGVTSVHLAAYRHSGPAAILHVTGPTAAVDGLVLLYPLDRYLQLEGLTAIPAVDVPLLMIGTSAQLTSAAPPEREVYGLLGQPADFRVRGGEIAGAISDFVDSCPAS